LGLETPRGNIRFIRRANWIIQHGGQRSGMKFLEIVCGTGNYSEYFSLSCAELLALDISEDLLSRARDRHLSETIHFIYQPYETIDMSEKFDAVVDSSVLHRLDIATALLPIFHLLKPGGIIVCTEPNMLNPQVMIQNNNHWINQRFGDFPDETAFVRWEIMSLLQNNKYENIKMTPLNWLHPAISSSAIAFFLRVEKVFEKIPIIREFAGSLYECANRPL